MSVHEDEMLHLEREEKPEPKHELEHGDKDNILTNILL